MDVYNLYVKIGLDSSAYDSGVKKVESDGKRLSEKLGIEAPIKSDSANYEKGVRDSEKASKEALKKLSIDAKIDASLTNFEQKVKKAETTVKSIPKNLLMKMGIDTNEIGKKVNTAKSSIDVIKKHVSQATLKLGIDTTEIHTKLDAVKEKASKVASTLGKGFSAAVGAVGAAVGTAATGIAALGKQSIEAYSEYEQLAGGVETLFGDASGKMLEYANGAYESAGMSANAYMNTVTSFSASLLKGLGGDTAAAAEIANQAVIDMSDNANKMGTDIEMIQNAYQGFAKQNYTINLMSAA